MAPTTTPEEEGQGSGLRSRARRRWRRRRTRVRRPSSPISTTAGQTETPSPHTQSTAGQPEPPASSQMGRRAGAASASVASNRAKKKRSRSGSNEQLKRRKNVRATDVGRESEGTGSKRSQGRAASASVDTASDASSAVSSPLRRPYFKQAVIDVSEWGDETLEPISNISPAILDAYDEHEAKYNAKRCNHSKLITLDRLPRPCLADDCAEEAVLKTAKFVLGLSSYIDGNLLAHASGFIIKWDSESKAAIVLTTSLLFRTKSPSMDEWLAKDEFAPHAEVHVHLLDKDDTTVTAELIHYDKHYSIALFKIKMDVVAQIPSFNAEVKFGQDICVLGRDKNRNLIVDHGIVWPRGPSCFERHHNVFTSCGVNELCLGGPVIDLTGQFSGMIILPEMAFVPSSIILKCLDIWKTNDCIPRLHTGMQFSAIEFMDPVHKEKLSRKCNINAGLIVTEVSDGSVAEKVGIRIGDVLEYWNGEVMSTTLELENFLLSICQKQLDNNGGIGSIVEIQVGIYHVRKDSRCTISLSLKLRNDVEVVARGEYDVSAFVVSQDDRDSE